MKMGKFLQRLVCAVVVLSATASLGGEWVGVGAAKVRHVVGGDRGWDPSSDLSGWSSARKFRVGDEIWISYSAAKGKIAELKSKEEYESCDARNPIKMYTDGLHSIPLEEEGIRYFVSTEPDNCNNGLKLHVEVLPMNVTNSTSSSSKEFDAIAATEFEALGPSTPSASPPYTVSSISIQILMFCISLMLLLLLLHV